MSVDNQKLFQKIVEELESLKGETEVLSIAILPLQRDAIR
ncbi:hypothetical protein AOT20_04900 [Klebsiella pneumoniae]|nr:hypothetical protein AOT20_04900 [Klebsiella pneumoniae]